jgi:hypothetical protein
MFLKVYGAAVSYGSDVTISSLTVASCKGTSIDLDGDATSPTVNDATFSSNTVLSWPSSVTGYGATVWADECELFMNRCYFNGSDDLGVTRTTTRFALEMSFCYFSERATQTMWVHYNTSCWENKNTRSWTMQAPPYNLAQCVTVSRTLPFVRSTAVRTLTLPRMTAVWTPQPSASISPPHCPADALQNVASDSFAFSYCDELRLPAGDSASVD